MELRGTLLLGAINTYMEELRLNFEASVKTNVELPSIASGRNSRRIYKEIGDGGLRGLSGFSQAFNHQEVHAPSTYYCEV